MDWNLEGKRVEVKYLDQYRVTGTVTESLVLLSGRVKHSVKLDEITSILGVLRDSMIVKHEEIVTVIEEEI